jgi:hypothetical protein
LLSQLFGQRQESSGEFLDIGLWLDGSADADLPLAS